MDSKTIDRIAEYFEGLSGNIALGVDGYIDEVWQVLKARAGRDEYTLYEKMKEFGEAIIKCESGGFTQEIIFKRRSHGGFTGNTGLALGRLGAAPVLIGMYGKNGIDPLFDKFSGICELISVSDPGKCQILEFQDGKIMLPYVEKVVDFGWDDFEDNIDKIGRAFLAADIIAIGYWSSVPAFDEFVSRICENYIENGKCRRMFFDFGDLRKRDEKSLEYTLERLAELNKTVPMTLSFNENETSQLLSHYGEEFDESKLEETVLAIRKRISLDELIIHTPFTAVVSSEVEGVTAVKQQHYPSPVITAGAGDTFNGGYIAGLLCGMDAHDRLLTANAATRFYVSNGFPPERNDIINSLVLY